MWKNLYVLISRINDALFRLNQLTDADLPTRSLRIAEMHFLRAQTYFKLKVLYKYVVYIDEDVPKIEYNDHHNRELTDQEGWAWIINAPLEPFATPDICSRIPEICLTRSK